jgi:type IV pilus assembly protein PilB
MGKETAVPPRPASPQPSLVERKLLTHLASRGLLGPAGEAKALAVQKSDALALPDALAKAGVLTREALLPALGEVLGVPEVDLTRTYGDPMVLDAIPKDVAYKMEALPLYLIEKQLTVAVADPDNLAKLDELRFVTGKEILPVVALREDLRKQIVECYGAPVGEGSGILDEAPLEFETPESEAPPKELNLEAAQGDRPVVRLLNLLLVRALEERASDIHLEPQESQVTVRYRVDGRLRVKPYGIPIGVLPALVSRIKVLANLDIAERRVPQDGKIRIRIAGRRVDLRVSTFTSIRDEKVVIRILDKERMDFRLDNLGMSQHVLDTWKRVIRGHQGILLVTGPTGSGKSSTLFATLRYLHKPEVNIVTLEDPVEYELEGITQGQVNEKAGFTFAKGVRSILRQDPDIIMVGEIRDTETAQIAVQAALTGHLVLASLHTNDAPSAVTRLRDIGVPPYLISAGLLSVLAQRLVRRLCPDCTQGVEPSDDERGYLSRWLGQADLPFVEGLGCPNCHSTGYRGRTAIHEIFEISPHLRLLIAQGVNAQELAAAGRKEGYRTLWADGLGKVRARATSLRELARVVDQDPGDA